MEKIDLLGTSKTKSNFLIHFFSNWHSATDNGIENIICSKTPKLIHFVIYYVYSNEYQKSYTNLDWNIDNEHYNQNIE